MMFNTKRKVQTIIFLLIIFEICSIQNSIRLATSKRRSKQKVSLKTSKFKRIQKSHSSSKDIWEDAKNLAEQWITQGKKAFNNLNILDKAVVLKKGFEFIQGPTDFILKFLWAQMIEKVGDIETAVQQIDSFINHPGTNIMLQLKALLYSILEKIGLKEKEEEEEVIKEEETGIITTLKGQYEILKNKISKMAGDFQWISLNFLKFESSKDIVQNILTYIIENYRVKVFQGFYLEVLQEFSPLGMLMTLDYKEESSSIANAQKEREANDPNAKLNDELQAHVLKLSKECANSNSGKAFGLDTLNMIKGVSSVLYDLYAYFFNHFYSIEEETVSANKKDMFTKLKNYIETFYEKLQPFFYQFSENFKECITNHKQTLYYFLIEKKEKVIYKVMGAAADGIIKSVPVVSQIRGVINGLIAVYYNWKFIALGRKFKEEDSGVMQNFMNNHVNSNSYNLGRYLGKFVSYIFKAFMSLFNLSAYEDVYKLMLVSVTYGMEYTPTLHTIIKKFSGEVGERKTKESRGDKVEIEEMSETSSSEDEGDKNQKEEQINTRFRKQKNEKNEKKGLFEQ
jgi:hypothetical protein